MPASRRCAPSHRRIRGLTLLGAALAASAPAAAIEIKTDNGWEGSLNTVVSVSQSWRVESAHKDLIGGDNAALAGLEPSEAAAFSAGYTATGGETNLNFKRGERYSTLFKFLTELDLRKGDMGALVRVKGWYDDALNNRNFHFGNQPNGYRTDKPLSDETFPRLNRFDGTALLDAYIYNSFDVGSNSLQVRLGRQAINWGESIFVLGANQLSPLDITALNKAGTQIKEALMPVWSVTGNLGLNDGMSLEGFYQFKWEPYNLENCGTFLGGDGASDNPGKCDLATSPLIDAEIAQTQDSFIPFVNSPKPRDSGQWGLAFRFPIDALDTEVGLYAMNYHSRIPFISGTIGGDLNQALADLPSVRGLASALVGSPLDVAQTRALLLQNGIPMTAWRNADRAFSAFSAANPGTLAGLVLGALAPSVQSVIANGLPTTEAFFEYPEDIKLYAISASTTLGGWSIGSELSYSPNTPVQLAPGDFTKAVIQGNGPVGTDSSPGGAGISATGSRAAGDLTPRSGFAKGWERTHKTQFQINGLNTLPPGVLGASTGLVIAEAGFQWAGIDDSTGSNKRYGRAFVFDAAQHTSYAGGICPLLSGVAGDPVPTGCANDGFMTRFSWGYRISASLSYPAVFGSSWRVSPSVFWSHDVKGYSIDYQFLEDRKTLSLGLNFSLNNVHNIGLNYTTYANNADFDPRRDKDNASIVYSFTF